MLPAPAHADWRRRQALKSPFARDTLSFRRSRWKSDIFRNLSGPSRATNLAVLLLVFVASVSLLLNISHWLYAPPPTPITSVSHDGDVKTNSNVSYSTLQSHHPAAIRLVRPPVAQGLTHLVLVPCHSIFLGASPEDRVDENAWALASFQRGRGRIQSFWRHIVAGARLAVGDEKALLVFSGGQTSDLSTFTEADSYLRLALLSDVFHPEAHTHPDASYGTTTIPYTKEHKALADASPSSFSRVTTETFALDSYQNLLFSVARFYQFTGHYPTKITVIGYEMKRERFTSIHRAALRWPADPIHFNYTGIDLDPTKEPDAWKGEIKNALEPYRKDVYGCHGELSKKRVGRNPFGRVHGYGTLVLPYSASTSPNEDEEAAGEGKVTEEEKKMLEEQVMVGELMKWCPGSSSSTLTLNKSKDEKGWTDVFGGPLPWDSQH